MADDLAAALADWLGRHGRGGVSVEMTGRAAGGLSQETWFVRMHDAASEWEAVLRLPTAASGGRAIVTQIDALRAVAGSPVPAPRVLFANDGGDALDGRPFLVMTRVRGAVPFGWHVLPPGRRERLARRAMDVLADLHALQIGATAFEGISPHPLMTLDGLARAFERLAPVPLPLTAALGWLARRRPPAERPPVLVHGDYRMGNFVVDGVEIEAVLDWELASPGAREVDLAWCFLPVFEDSGVDEEPLIGRYERRAGVVIDRGELAWHRVLAFTRLAYYALAGTRAFDAGRSRDLRLAALRLRLPDDLARLAAAMTAVDQA